jgi:dodecin
LIGTGTDSRERAVAATVERASRSLRHLRIAVICELDLQLDGGHVVAYRATVKDMRAETEATYSSESTPGRRLAAVGPPLVAPGRWAWQPRRSVTLCLTYLAIRRTLLAACREELDS